MSSIPLKKLATYLSGEFENPAQAAAEPSWYVHFRLWHRLVPGLSSPQCYTFFLEQATVGAGKPPYRQRILQLRDLAIDGSIEGAAGSGELRGEYFALRDPLKFRGASADPGKLNAMSAADLVSLPNSEAHIKYQSMSASGGLTVSESDYKFQSALPEGQLCSFDYDGQTRYVYLGFDVFSVGKEIELLIYDKGIAPDTGRGLWGALMGPFKMIKQQSYSL